MGISLTFDDGPDPAGTPLVLAALRATGATATFFVIGERVRRHPRLLDAILAAGHRIGVHCDEHIRHSRRDAGWARRDLRRALRSLAAHGVDPSLWRTPWGDRAPWTAELARAHALELVDWTVDTHDWRGDGPDQMLDATRAQLRDGAVVLAHDGIGPGARRTDASATAAYVRLAAAVAADRRLELTSLG